MMEVVPGLPSKKKARKASTSSGRQSTEEPVLRDNRFDKMVLNFDWIDATKKLRYIETGEIFCTMCSGKKLQVGSKGGNLGVHAATQRYRR